MKKYFVLFTLLYLLNPPAQAMEKTNAMALTSIALLSTSLFCALEGTNKHMKSWDTLDPHQKQGLFICGNAWLKGALLTGIPGFALLGTVAAGKAESSKVIACGFASSVMLALTASFLKAAQECDEEFKRTNKVVLAKTRDKYKYMAIGCLAAGVILCNPVIEAQ